MGNGQQGAPRGWRAATEEALYGPAGFYRRPEGPAGHFRTSVHASPLFAGAVAELLCRVDAALGEPAELAFVDMAAGRGELVSRVLQVLPEKVAPRVCAYAVEKAEPPADLDHRIETAEFIVRVARMAHHHRSCSKMLEGALERGPDG